MGANDFFSARARVLGFLDESDDVMPCIYVLSRPRFVAEWGWERSVVDGERRERESLFSLPNEDEHRAGQAGRDTGCKAKRTNAV